MRNFSARPKEIAASFWRNRALIRIFAQREVLGRYRGSVFGILWSLFNPIFMLAVYTFVFSVIFQARWGSGGGSKTEFALVLFAGLLVFNLFSECISRAPNQILGNANFVKKIIFPLEILPWVTLSGALFHFFVSLGVWLVAHFILFGPPHLSTLLLPLILLPLVFFIMGLSWALASLGVFLRDVSQIIGVLVSIMMFLTPIFYPAAALPPSYQSLIYLNPLTPAIEWTRDVLFWGKPPDPTLLAFYWVYTSLICWLGFFWFQKTRKGFADVL